MYRDIDLDYDILDEAAKPHEMMPVIATEDSWQIVIDQSTSNTLNSSTN